MTNDYGSTDPAMTSASLPGNRAAKRGPALVACVSAGALLVIAMGVVLAVVMQEPGGWVVITVIQIPIGATLGVLSWLVWLWIGGTAYPSSRIGVGLRSALTAATFAALSFLYWSSAPGGQAALIRGTMIVAIGCGLVGILLLLATRHTPQPHSIRPSDLSPAPEDIAPLPESPSRSRYIAVTPRSAGLDVRRAMEDR